jgi:hypothetical protein
MKSIILAFLLLSLCAFGGKGAGSAPDAFNPADHFLGADSGRLQDIPDLKSTKRISTLHLPMPMA